jgi:glycosyltransferase involved in cell wall biosynthesis
MLVQRKYSIDPTVLTASKDGNIISVALRDRLDRLPLRFYRHRKDTWWTVGWLHLDIANVIRKLQPDVVHFHWTGRGLAPIRLVRHLREYPIAWTLRDMWPLTGGCHYSHGCERFLTGCGACPQLSSKHSYDLSAWQWRRKRHAWDGVSIAFVVLSRWMADYARKSPLVADNEVCLIHTGIDLGVFRPIDRAASRLLWRLPDDRKIILFGALRGTSDPRKGFRYFREAVRKLIAGSPNERYICVVFGAENGPTDFAPDVRYVGALNDSVSLASLYASADVMVVPSTEENLGKTALEAMSCGTPVVAYANSGQLDIVSHKNDGYLAENLSVDDLAAGIAWCLDRQRDTNLLRATARAKAERNFDIRSAALKHTSLYERLIADRLPARGIELSGNSLAFGPNTAPGAQP